jgi:Rod binding domain-containing protein
MITGTATRSEPLLAAQQPSAPALRRAAAPRPGGPAMPQRTTTSTAQALPPAADKPIDPKQPAMPTSNLQQTLHPHSADDKTRQDAQQVATQFEELFVGMMVQDLRKTAQFGGDEDGLFGSGPGADTYADWFDQNLAQDISKNGRVGITDVLMKEFERAQQIPKAPPKQAALHTQLGKGGLDVAG